MCVNMEDVDRAESRVHARDNRRCNRMIAAQENGNCTRGNRSLRSFGYKKIILFGLDESEITLIQ